MLLACYSGSRALAADIHVLGAPCERWPVASAWLPVHATIRRLGAICAAYAATQAMFLNILWFFVQIANRMATTLREFHVVGRKTPTETDPAPQIYRMRVFAKNDVQAKSRFW